MDIAGIALVILMMAINGDFNLTETKTGADTISTEAESASAAAESEPAVPETLPLLSPEETLARMGERYSFTPREAEVLQKLLLTEDELQPIADSMNNSCRVLSRHISSIYEKTGKTSRVGLYQLYHATSQECGKQCTGLRARIMEAEQQRLAGAPVKSAEDVRADLEAKLSKQEKTPSQGGSGM